MTNKKNPYSEKALQAASRAASKVLIDSLLHNRPLPIWVDGKVEYKLPTQEEIDSLCLGGGKLEAGSSM